jgi:hypothetical protein
MNVVSTHQSLMDQDVATVEPMLRTLNPANQPSGARVRSSSQPPAATPTDQQTEVPHASEPSLDSPSEHIHSPHDCIVPQNASILPPPSPPPQNASILLPAPPAPPQNASSPSAPLQRAYSHTVATHHLEHMHSMPLIPHRPAPPPPTMPSADVQPGDAYGIIKMSASEPPAATQPTPTTPTTVQQSPTYEPQYPILESSPCLVTIPAHHQPQTQHQHEPPQALQPQAMPPTATLSTTQYQQHQQTATAPLALPNHNNSATFVDQYHSHSHHQQHHYQLQPPPAPAITTSTLPTSEFPMTSEHLQQQLLILQQQQAILQQQLQIQTQLEQAKQYHEYLQASSTGDATAPTLHQPTAPVYSWPSQQPSPPSDAANNSSGSSAAGDGAYI